MTGVRTKRLPGGALGEMLLHQSPGCAWVLRRDGGFQAVYGDSVRVFGRAVGEFGSIRFGDLCEPVSRDLWNSRVERVFCGETVRAAGQFARGCFAITLFPIRLPGGEIAFAGGIAYPTPGTGVVLRTLAALDASRTHLSQLLHDHVGQGLTAVGLQLDLLRMDLAGAAPPVEHRIGEIQDTLETIVTLVRDTNRELNLGLAERVGLRAALDRLAGSVRSNFQGNVRVFADAKAQPPPETAAALYRIAQEATGQAVRRDGCSTIEILLKSLRHGPMLEIRDNGCDGADTSPEAGGLLVMQYFAEQAGIELQITSARDRGTVVQALYRTSSSKTSETFAPAANPQPVEAGE